MTDRSVSLCAHVRGLIVAAIGETSGLASIDLPDGSIGVVDLDDSQVFVVTVRPGKFEVADGD